LGAVRVEAAMERVGVETEMVALVRVAPKVTEAEVASAQAMEKVAAVMGLVKVAGAWRAGGAMVEGGAPQEAVVQQGAGAMVVAIVGRTSHHLL
jgi:hypothetical protein